jgi:hypothetical protein
LTRVDCIIKLVYTALRLNHKGLTDGLDEQSRHVEEEQGDVEEVEEGFYVRQDFRVVLQAGQSDVDGTSAHTNGELLFTNEYTSPHSIRKDLPLAMTSRVRDEQGLRQAFGQ